MGLGCSVQSLNKEKKNFKCKKQSKEAINYIVIDPIVKRQGETMAEKIHEAIDFSKNRDLYNRTNRLQTSLDRVNGLPNPDKDDILAHVQHLLDERRAKLTIIRNISSLITFREKLGKSFRNATASDLRDAFSKMEKDGWKTKQGKIKEYSSWTDKKFRDVIKKFYKVVFGNNEQYPEEVRWIKTKFTKDKSVKKLDMKKFLTYEQIKKLIRITKDLQRKTLLAVCYELGARPGELLALINLNLHEDENGLWCTINESKTDERVIKIVEYKALLKQWIANHPLNHLPIYPLWISEATNYKNEPLGIAGAEKIAEEMIAKVDPTKKAKLYTLRHSRATFLAKCGWSEKQLCLYFGWSQGSDQPDTYIHLSGRDLNDAISALYENKQTPKHTKIILDSCINCKEELYTEEPTCPRCGESTSMAEIYLTGIKKDAERHKQFESSMQVQTAEIIQLKKATKAMFHFIQDYIVGRSAKGKEDEIMKFNYEDIFEKDTHNHQ